jgi:hypothetical protein
MNRAGLGRHWVGDVAYIAVWNRVLDLTELRNAQNNGPLDEPDGLVLLWANEEDLGPNALTPDARSTFAAGTIPPNDALGGDTSETFTLAGAVIELTGGTLDLPYTPPASTFELAGAVLTLTGGSLDLPYTPPASTETFTLGGAALTVTGGALSFQSIRILDDFEASNVTVSTSTVTGVGDDAVIRIQPRKQVSSVISGARFLSPAFKISGVNGLRPTIIIDQVTSGTYHAFPWDTGRRMLYSYDDGATWTPFDTNHTIGGGEVSLRNSTAFTSDEVLVSWTRLSTPTNTRAWVDALAAAHPTLIGQTASSTDFVVGTYTAQTDDLGRTIPSYPCLGFKISDSSLVPANGQPKRAVLIESGIHAGEAQADFVMRQAVEFLLGDSAEAENVRQHFDVWVYPLINPMGRAGGHWRGSFEEGPSGEDDANRFFSTEPAPIEIVDIPRSAYEADLPATVEVALHFHGMFSTRKGFYKDGTAAHAIWDAAMAALEGTQGDIGNSHPGFAAIWSKNLRNCRFYITTETGEPTPWDDAVIASYGSAHIKAISNILDAGNMPGPSLFTLAGATLELAGGELAFTYTPPAGVEVLTLNGAALALSGGDLAFTYTPPSAPETLVLGGAALTLTGGALAFTYTPPAGVETFPLAGSTLVLTGGQLTFGNPDLLPVYQATVHVRPRFSCRATTRPRYVLNWKGR